MPLSTELREALARSRRRLRLWGGTVNQEGGTRAPLLQENSDTVPAEDPDDFIDQFTVAFLGFEEELPMRITVGAYLC